MSIDFMDEVRSDHDIADKLTNKYEGWATICINRNSYDKMVKALLAVDDLIKEQENLLPPYALSMQAYNKIRNAIEEATRDASTGTTENKEES